MGREGPATRSERILFAALLPLGGGLVVLLFTGVFLKLANPPDGVLELLRPAGVVCFALGAPLFMQLARPFSGLRRSLAGLAGLASGLALTSALISMGVAADAMNHIGEPPACLTATEALLHEGALVVLGYGGAILAGFLALGAPRQAQAPAQFAPRPLERPHDPPWSGLRRRVILDATKMNEFEAGLRLSAGQTS